MQCCSCSGTGSIPGPGSHAVPMANKTKQNKTPKTRHNTIFKLTDESVSSSCPTEVHLYVTVAGYVSPEFMSWRPGSWRHRMWLYLGTQP